MNKKIKIYAEILEDSALSQFNEAMVQDEAIQGALMSDAHTGYTLPIGSVIKSKKIYPSYVGVDIGCGVIGVELKIQNEKNIDLEKLRDLIVEKIPLGKYLRINSQFNKYKEVFMNKHISKGISKYAKKVLNSKFDSSIATLGGGNHFIEICRSVNTSNLWVVVHSGSRGVGGKIGSHYMDLAAAYVHNPTKEEINIEVEKFKIGREDTLKYNPEAFELAFRKHWLKVQSRAFNSSGHNGLPLDEELGKQYLKDMEMCLDFALLNRELMFEIVYTEIRNMVGSPNNITTGVIINTHHNHAENVGDGIIHRKGATHADLNIYSIIPANMRDGSFVVRGLGNKESLCSSSHGAGRVMSRIEARKRITIKELKKDMKGIVNNHSKDTVDEAPSAYKNIFDVMEAQKDLVEVVDRIIPLVNIKG